MVTLAVCPLLFEFLTTLTFGAQRGNHSVSTAFETMAETNTETREKWFVHMRSAIYHEL